MMQAQRSIRFKNQAKFKKAEKLLSEGVGTTEIAQRCGVTPMTVRQWRARITSTIPSYKASANGGGLEHGIRLKIDQKRAELRVLEAALELLKSST
jgi:transposase-like protein